MLAQGPVTRARAARAGCAVLGAFAHDRSCEGKAETGRGMSTIERARGRWSEILPRLGIDARFLRNRHGPCPLCGGKDRFRFDDRDGSGSYFCNQ